MDSTVSTDVHKSSLSLRTGVKREYLTLADYKHDHRYAKMSTTHSTTKHHENRQQPRLM